jgi:hypothetical protein
MLVPILAMNLTFAFVFAHSSTLTKYLYLNPLINPIPTKSYFPKHI